MRGRTERAGRAAAGQAGADHARGVAPVLHSGGRRRAARGRDVADREHLGPARQREVAASRRRGRHRRAARPPSAASTRASGDGSTPAAHRTVRASTRPPSASSSPSGVQGGGRGADADVDARRARGPAPRDCARRLGKSGSSSGPDLEQRDRRAAAPSRADASRARSATCPASTPVGPPPTTAKRTTPGSGSSGKPGHLERDAACASAPRGRPRATSGPARARAPSPPSRSVIVGRARGDDQAVVLELQRLDPRVRRGRSPSTSASTTRALRWRPSRRAAAARSRPR